MKKLISLLLVIMTIATSVAFTATCVSAAGVYRDCLPRSGDPTAWIWKQAKNSGDHLCLPMNYIIYSTQTSNSFYKIERCYDTNGNWAGSFVGWWVYTGNTTSHTHHVYSYKTTKAATCMSGGEVTGTCVCGAKTSYCTGTVPHRFSSRTMCDYGCGAFDSSGVSISYEYHNLYVKDSTHADYAPYAAGRDGNSYTAGSMISSDAVIINHYNNRWYHISGTSQYIVGEHTVIHDGHTWNGGTTTKYPTCQAWGSRTYTCNVCRQTKTESIAPVNHVYNSECICQWCEEAFDPASVTITANGPIRLYVKKDGVTDSAPYAKSKNRGSVKAGSVITASCQYTNKWSNNWYKLNDGSYLNEDYVVVHNSCSFNAGTVTTQPTCAKAGVRTRVCTVCGAKKTESIPRTSNHKFDSGSITTKPTCAMTGIRTYSCTVCGAKKTESVTKVKHSYDAKTHVCVYGCGNFDKSSVKKTENVPMTRYVIKDGVYSQTGPYKDCKKLARYNKGDRINITAKVTNAANHVWYLLDTGAYIWSDNTSSPSISLNTSSKAIYNGMSATISATTFPASSVKWSSSNTSIATVSASGKVSAQSTGTCTITAAMSIDGTAYKASCKVTTSDLRYSITFNPNCSSYDKGSDYATSNACVYHKSVRLPSNPYVRAGYSFSGWTTAVDGKVVYAPGESVSALTKTNGGKVTLYAVWSRNKLSISYNANGGSVKNTTVNDKYYYNTLLADGSITHNSTGSSCTKYAQIFYYTTETDFVNASSFGLTRTGYKFTGWNTRADGTGTNYDQTTKYKATSLKPGVKFSNQSLTLYAVWHPETYKITYNGNGASGSMSSTSATYDKEVNLRNLKFKAPADRTFAGWARTPDGNVEFADGASVKNLSSGSTVTLYAVWRLSLQAKIEAFKNEPDWAPGAVYTNSVVVDGKEYITRNKCGPYRLGQGCWAYVYDFVYYVSDGTINHFNKGAEYYDPAEVRVGDVWKVTDHFFAVTDVIAANSQEITIKVLEGGYSTGSGIQHAHEDTYTYENNGNCWHNSKAGKNFIKGYHYEFPYKLR